MMELHVQASSPIICRAIEVTCISLSSNLWQCLLRRLIIFLHAFCLGVSEGLQSGLQTLCNPPELTPVSTSLSSVCCFYYPGSTTRSDAHPVLSSPPWTTPVVQDLVTSPVLWPSRLPVSCWVEQWFAQRELPVTQSPRICAQVFFQKLWKWQHLVEVRHTRESRSLKLPENISIHQARKDS